MYSSLYVWRAWRKGGAGENFSSQAPYQAFAWAWPIWLRIGGEGMKCWAQLREGFDAAISTLLLPSSVRLQTVCDH